jgi:nucleoside phosphorylase
MSAERGTVNAEPGGSAQILVCFAVREEAKYFQSAGADSVLITGIGPRNAEQAFQSAITQHKPSLVLTCGFAGGLNPELQRGEVVFDATDADSLLIPLQRAGARQAKFHCADLVAVTASDKKLLRQQTNADVVEMESGIIRQRCHEAGISAATIRIVSDDAATDLPLNFNELAKPNGNISYAKLSLALLGSPGKIPRLIQFQKELDECSRRLGALLAEVIRNWRQTSP